MLSGCSVASPAALDSGPLCLEVGGPPTNDKESDPDAAAMLEQLEQEMKEKSEEPQDEKDPEPEGTLKSYECQVCG